MQAISDFFAANYEEIIVSLIVGISLLAISAICYFIRKKIAKLLNPYPEEAEKRKQLSERIKTKTTTPQDFDYLIYLSMRKIRLNRREKKFYLSQEPVWFARMSEARQALEEACKPYDSNTQP